MTISIKLVENAYFRVNNRVDVFFLVPLLIMIGLFSMPLGNYFLLLFCFIAGFVIKYKMSGLK